MVEENTTRTNGGKPMNAVLRRTLQLILAATVMIMAGCSGTTTIESDLALGGHENARLDLHQKTEAIDLVNNRNVPVRIKVLGKRDRVVSNMVLNGHDQVRLDILTARAVEFENESDEPALLRWTLRSHDRIAYTMALNP
jgi:hypothetical protein